MQIVGYLINDPAGTFKLKLRPTGRWRALRHGVPCFEETFNTAEEAAEALARQFDTPVKVEDWEPIESNDPNADFSKTVW